MPPACGLTPREVQPGMLKGVDDDLLPIGRFARLSRLSVKQLRHYDEIGLLVPAWVDPATGYRYYRASQAPLALSIGLLRSLEVPLPVVARVLAGERQALAGVRDEAEAELARRRRTLAALERLLADGLPAPQVTVVREPARRVLTARERADGPEEIGRATSAAVARVTRGLAGGPEEIAQATSAVAGVTREDTDGPEGIARATPAEVARGTEPAEEKGGVTAATGEGDARLSGASPAGLGETAGDVRLIGVFPADLGETVEVLVALEVPEQKWRDRDGLRAETLAGGMFAAARHTGPYDQIPLTAAAVLGWCGERRLTALEVREVYVSDPRVTPPERLETDVLVRFEQGTVRGR